MNTETTKTIADNIDRYRKPRKVTQKALASELGMTANSLRSKMRGESEWKWSEILKLSEITGMTPTELAGV